MKHLSAFFCTVLALLMFAAPHHAAAAYPDRTITMIVAFGAGGSADAMARTFSELLSRELGATIIVKNVVGGAGTLGQAELYKAAPDGYTLAFHPMGVVVSQPNLRKLPYAWDAFTPIAMITQNPQTLVTPKNLPWKNFKEAYEILKANPNKYMFVSSSPGGVAHVAQEAIFHALDLKLGHLPTKDGASAAQALVSGTAQFFCDPPILIKQFDLIGLAIMADERSPACPDVPTFKELGFPQVPNLSLWQGLFAPKNLPADILARLEEASKKVVESDQFQEICAKAGMQSRYMNSADFDKQIRADYALFDQILRESGFKK